MIPSSLVQALADRGLSAHAKCAYAFCLAYLDGDEWRAVKLEQVMVAIRCEKLSAVRAMRALAAAKYVAVRGDARPREYRLLPAPLPAHKARAA